MVTPIKPAMVCKWTVISGLMKLEVCAYYDNYSNLHEEHSEDSIDLYESELCSFVHWYKFHVT